MPRSSNLLPDPGRLLLANHFFCRRRE